MGLFRAVLATLYLSCGGGTILPPAPPDIGDVSLPALLPAMGKLVNAQISHAPEVTLHFDSPGGDIMAMRAFAALMHRIEESGTKIVCVVDGDAGSAAFYLLQQCSERVAHPGSRFLWHQYSALLRENAYTARELEEIARELRAGSHEASVEIAKRLRISADELERRIADRDYFFDAREALEIGAIDRIQ